jgi:hypothetical protein
MSWAERPAGMEAPGHDIRGGEIEAVLDQISLLTASLGTLVNRTTNQSIPNTTFTDLTFPNIEADNMSNFVSGGSVITVTRTAMYNVQIGCIFANVAGGVDRSIIVMRNGVEVPASGQNEVPNAAASPRLSATSGIVCSAGDTISTRVYQDSGGAINITSARLSVVWMGDF